MPNIWLRTIENHGTKTLLGIVCTDVIHHQDFPTIIVKGKQSCNKLYIQLPTNIMDYLYETSWTLKEAVTVESYYGRSIYIEDPKYKEVDPFLFKPFQINERFLFRKYRKATLRFRE